MTWASPVARWLGIPRVRAIRGATTVASDDPATIRAAVLELLEAMRGANAFQDDEVISAIFTVTPDLTAAFPAEAARAAGWRDVPLLCATEIAVPGSMPRCLRVLLHVEREWRAHPTPVYLHDAAQLRPDIAPPRGLHS